VKRYVGREIANITYIIVKLCYYQNYEGQDFCMGVEQRPSAPWLQASITAD